MTFFFGSAAASSAYLTVGELFPSHMRASAISIFYVVAIDISFFQNKKSNIFIDKIGTSVGPLLFGKLIDMGERSVVFYGYVVSASLMILGGIAVAFLGVETQSIFGISSSRAWSTNYT